MLRSSCRLQACTVPRTAAGPFLVVQPAVRGRLAQPTWARATVQASPETNDAEYEYENCDVAFVTHNNKAHPNSSLLTLEGTNYSGLLRIITWCLNGLSIRVQHAELKTDGDRVTDNFWLTDLQGHKLDDKTLASVAERLQQFVMSCAPTVDGNCRETWNVGRIAVSNIAHPTYTELIIKGEPSKPGFLLEICTVLAASGASVWEATVCGGEDTPVGSCDAKKYGHDFKDGRFFRIYLKDLQGNKLDCALVSSLLFALDLVAGKGHVPTTPPSMDFALKL